MKFIACADLHWSESVPKNRVDEYSETCLLKFKQILDICIENKDKKNEPILTISGDLFDKPNCSYEFLSTLVKLIRESGVLILSVAGQHDMRYHDQDLSNTPYNVLNESCFLHDVSEEPFHSNGASFFGLNWEQDDSFVREKKKEGVNVLLIHKMVVRNNALFPGQTGYETGKSILKKYPEFKYIISGDNHEPHLITMNGRTNINCGCVMRNTKALVDFKPAVWLVNTNSECKQIRLDVKSKKKVFDFHKIEIEEQNEKDRGSTDAFIESLKNTVTRPDFVSVLNKVIKEEKPKKSVRKIIDQLVREAKEE